MKIRWPGDTDRMSIVGTTGSGKTQAALWQLSTRDFDRKPWVIFDFKHDDLINSIEGTQEISLDDPAPIHRGIYIVHPNPGDDTEPLLWRIWAQENIGVYIDEGVMIGNSNNAYRSCLTQGRSKHIPMIILCQRPVWIDPFTFSESDFYQVFHLGWKKDVQKMMEFIPNETNEDQHPLLERLPRYYSHYYDRSERQLVKLRAVPDRDAILDTFDLKLMKLRKVV